MKEKFENFKKNIEGKKVAVIGVGISNRPLIKFLYGLGADITAFDALPSDDPVLSRTIENFEIEGVNINWSVGEGYLDSLLTESFDYIFKTPKMRVENEYLAKAKARGSVLTSEMEMFISLCPCKIFGITGSDGKTTTTTLVSEMLKKEGYTVYCGGNIGTPLLDRIEEINEDDMVVLELSSFQLLHMADACDVAIVTNVTPNHLDFHKDYDEYIESKTHIFKNQNCFSKLILNSACEITYNMKDQARGKLGFFSLDRSTSVVPEGDALISKAYLKDGILCYELNGKVTEIIDEKEILIPGKHNVENYLAAISAVYEYVSVETIVEIAKNFPGVEHRIEFIRELDGVKYYNSSIDTSPNRTINTMHALKDRNQHGVLIAGGADKKCIYEGLGNAILEVCDRIVLCGSNAALIKDILEKEASGRNYQVYEFDNYEDAVNKAKEISVAGDIVILSPVGTSYDKFRHFEERGNLFKNLVKAL